MCVKLYEIHLRDCSTLFDHVEEHAREDHAEQHQHSDDDARHSNDFCTFADEPRSDFIAAFRVNVREIRIVLARLTLNTVNRLTARQRNLSLPIAERLNATALQTRLCDVPG